MRLQLSNNEMHLACTWWIESRDVRFLATLFMTCLSCCYHAIITPVLDAVPRRHRNLHARATKKVGSWVIG
jgi:hypothetical protein